MKTYLFDSLARFKRFSESLDVATTLSNKTWVVFNDSGERELYIFKPDGSVFITTNGVGYKGTWEWISANQSLIIQHDKVIYMLHPEIVEECVLVLTLDGTKDCVFLIEDQNRQSFAPKTLTQLLNHFEEKAKKVLEAEQQRRRKLEQEKMAAFMKAEQARRARIKAEREEQRRQEEALLRGRAARFRNDVENPIVISYSAILFGVLFSCVYVIVLCNKSEMSVFIKYPIIGVVVIGFLILSGYLFVDGTKSIKKRIAKYKAEHPNDPVNKYL